MKISKIWNSFSFRCIVFCLLVFIVPTAFLTSSLYQQSQRLSLSEARNFIASNLKNVADSYEEVLKNIDLYHFQPLNDENFLNYGNLPDSFATNYEQMYIQNEIERTIKFYLMTGRDLDSIYLYHSGIDEFHNYSLYYRSPSQDFFENRQSKIKEFISGRGNRKFLLKRELYSQEPVITSSSRVNLFIPSDAPVYFSINLDFSGLAHRLLNSLPSYVRFFVSDSEGSTVSISQDGDVQFLTSEFPEPPASGEMDFQLSESGDTLLCAYTVPYSGFVYHAEVPLSAFNSTPELIKSFMKSLFSTIFIILSIILLLSSLYFIRPIKQVYQAMNQVEAGDLSVRIPVTRSDELGYIQKGLNSMLESIRNLISENYEYTMRRQEMELKYIHTQINEHFLYNTLDSIHWIAQKNHVPEISNIIFNLSSFYRLTLSGGNELIPVSSVIQIFQAYVELVNIRLNRKVHLICRVEDGIRSRSVLKYIFQPVLENSIYHGINKSDHDGIVAVHFSQEENGGILCEIRDNGIGMDPLTLERLRRSLSSDQDYAGDFFALKNIQKQLKLYYGDSSSLAIESEWGKGTKVSIHIPKTEG